MRCATVRAFLVLIGVALGGCAVVGCRDRAAPAPAPGVADSPPPETVLVKVRCGECEGKGQLPGACPKCRGGRCPRCMGLKDQTCPACKGAGGVNGRRCVTCTGAGFYRCQLCFGIGTCGECAGKGNGPPRTCLSCAGKGEYEEYQPAPGSPPDTWVEIGNPDSGFVARTPSPPEHTGNQTPDGTVTAAYELRRGKTTYHVGVVVFPKAIDPILAAMLDPGRMILQSIPDSRIVEEKRLTTPTAGTELKIALPDGTVLWSRTYVTGNRLHSISLQGPEGVPDTPDAKRFMHSLRLLNR